MACAFERRSGRVVPFLSRMRLVMVIFPALGWAASSSMSAGMSISEMRPRRSGRMPWRRAVSMMCCRLASKPSLSSASMRSTYSWAVWMSRVTVFP